MARHRRIDYMYMHCKHCQKVSEVIQYTTYHGFGSQSKTIKWLCHETLEEEEYKYYHRRRQNILEDLFPKKKEPLELIRCPLEEH